MKILVGIGIAGLVALIVFTVLDITLGEPMSLECSVTGRYYVPPQTTVSVDAEGDVSVDTDPEEFHITVDETDGSRRHDIKTSNHLYDLLTNNQIVRVSARLGKWTHSVHIGAIESP